MTTGDRRPKVADKMKTEEIMKKPLVCDVPNLTITSPDATAEEALKLMVSFKIHHLLVFQGEDFVGLLSDRDIISHAFRGAGTKSFSSLRVSEVMRKDVPAIRESTAVSEGLSLMIDAQLSALPVLKGGRVVGLVTESDMLRALQRLLRGNHPIETAIAKGESLLVKPFTTSLIWLLSEIGL